MISLTRRELLASGAALPAIATASSLTVADVLERIRAHVGIPWFPKTVDKLVAGTPETPVRGIAATMMATIDVLERATAEGCNLIVTHETPFYLHQDDTSDLKDDPTLAYKLQFIRKYDLAIFHFHDHWHARQPDGIATGMARELDWVGYTDSHDARRFVLPSIALDKLAHQIKTRLHARAIRVLGDPKMRVSNVFASWGYVSRMPGIPQFRDPRVDLMIAGETREWELVEYAQDCIDRGQKKALMLLGHVVSEQGGMSYCAEWLRSFISEVPIKFVATPEPFWIAS